MGGNRTQLDIIGLLHYWVIALIVFSVILHFNFPSTLTIGYMVRFTVFTALFTLLFSTNITPQSVEFLPGKRLFNMLRAADTEPKFGLTFAPDDNSTKVDVGNAFDVLSIQFDPSTTLNAGVEFFAYAKVIEYRDYRLQVAAIDGYFGGNISYLKKLPDSPHHIIARLRFIHRSAHLVDGAWDPSTNSWKDGVEPVPFADDFFELNPAIQLKYPLADIRVYGGLAYSILIRPQDQERFSFSAGSEIIFNNSLFSFLKKPVRIYGAWDIKMKARPKFLPSYSLMTGVKFGEKQGIGLSIFAFYYSGYDYFSAYYKSRLNKFGMGFFLDFNP